MIDPLVPLGRAERFAGARAAPPQAQAGEPTTVQSLALAVAQLEELAGLPPLGEAAGREGDEGALQPRLATAIDALRQSVGESRSNLRLAELEILRLESSLRALRAASRVAESVASAFERERVLAAIPEQLTRIFGAATARVWLVGQGDHCADCPQNVRCERDRQCLQLVEYGEPGPLDLALRRVPIGDYSVGRVAALAAQVTTNDLASAPGLTDPDWAAIEGITSFAGYPLLHEGVLLGVLAMWCRSPLREETLEALRILARHASTAIVGAQLIDDVREESAREQAASGRLSALLEAERSGVILFDQKGVATYVNGPFRRLFALAGRPLVGQDLPSLEALLRPLVQARDGVRPPILQAPIDDAREEKELLILRRGDAGPRVFRRYTAQVAAPSGESMGWVAVFDDVTQAHEIDRMKSEFISTVSHELRTPLTSIKGSLALLLDSELPLDEETRQLITVSKRNADRLVRLVSDVLDLSKIEAGKLDLRPEPMWPDRLCADAVAGLAGFAQQMGVAIATHCEDRLPAVQADGDRVVQVLTNLLSNAIKFSPGGGEVQLSAARDLGQVVFSVRDQGPGIPAEFRAKLFTRFAQAERKVREQAGTGLGLAISQALVLKHGGRIWCDSTPGQGATFLFTLPMSGPDQEPG
jgi:signal transduction histidine kinase